jgi:hypothetical protein
MCIYRIMFTYKLKELYLIQALISKKSLWYLTHFKVDIHSCQRSIALQLNKDIQRCNIAATTESITNPQ